MEEGIRERKGWGGGGVVKEEGKEDRGKVVRNKKGERDVGGGGRRSEE